VWTTNKINKLSFDWLYTHTIPLKKVNLVYRIWHRSTRAFKQRRLYKVKLYGVIGDRLLYNLLLQALSLFQPFVGLYGNCLEYVQYTGLAKKKSAYIYRRWQFSSSPATPQQICMLDLGSVYKFLCKQVMFVKWTIIYIERANPG
jgi:hypothetical protein